MKRLLRKLLRLVVPRPLDDDRLRRLHRLAEKAKRKRDVVRSGRERLTTF